MKRWFTIMAAVMLAVMLTACSETADGVPDDAGKSSKALFVGREGGGDALAVKQLKNLGYEVYVVGDKELTTEQALNYGLVFVSSSVNSGRVSNKLKDSPVPVIYAESQNLGDVNLSGKASDVDNGDYTGKAIAIREAGHPIADGLSGMVDVYQSDGKIGFVVPEGEGVIVASAPDDERRAVIAAFEKGSKNMSGEPLPERRAYFYLVNGEEINQTDNGWKLFAATVRWAVGGK